MYAPDEGRWKGVDALADQAPDWTPYRYGFNNPVKFVDPNGNYESTIVKPLDDGTYMVVDGKDDGDTGVYLDNGKRGKGEKIGDSLTPYSFLSDDGKNAIVGAIIDLNSVDGQDFLDILFEDDPSVTDYMSNAKEKETYDFKTDCMDECVGEDESTKEQTIYKYRGSVLADGTIVSARDVGNVGAGWVSGKTGIPWSAHRFTADRLETKQHTGNYLGIVPPAFTPSDPLTGVGEQYKEGKPTVSAQRVGWEIGLRLYKSTRNPSSRR